MSPPTHICLKYQWRCSVLRSPQQNNKCFGKCKVQRITGSLWHLIQNLLNQCNSATTSNSDFKGCLLHIPRHSKRLKLFIILHENNHLTLWKLCQWEQPLWEDWVLWGCSSICSQALATLYVRTSVCTSLRSSWLTQRQTTAGLKFQRMTKVGEKNKKPHGH